MKNHFNEIFVIFTSYFNFHSDKYRKIKVTVQNVDGKDRIRCLVMVCGLASMCYFWSIFKVNVFFNENGKSRKENPQKLTQLSSRSHPRHLVGKRTAQQDTIIDITSDSQVNSNFPYRWSPASLTFNSYL